VSGSEPAVLAIDGGNSKTDVALVAADGTLLAQVRGPGSDTARSDLKTTVKMLDGLVAAAAATAGIIPADAGAGPPGSPVAAHLSACLANADLPEDEERLGAALAAQGWTRSTCLVNDTFAVLRAGLEGAERWGIAVVCGAGINCVGVAPDGRITRFLALGPESGDWGGGRKLADQSLWWAMRAEDGRGPQTMLREAVAQHFGAAQVSAVAIGVHTGDITQDQLLDLAPVLLETARRGDEVARNLVRRLADEITVMALTLMRRLDLTSSAVSVVLGGGLLTARDPLLTELIVTGLAAQAPRADIRIVDVPPIAGAALLGLDHLGAPASAEARLRRRYQSRPPATFPSVTAFPR
jgi:N-acetylglucosamine kinase-like BadF-type ATPase